jgi:hypothetical protein
MGDRETPVGFELASQRAADLSTPATASMVPATVAGILGGLVAGAASGGAYYLANRSLPLPWVKLGAVFVFYTISSGALWGASIQRGILALQGRGASAGAGGIGRLVAGGAAGGMVGGVAIGALGVGHFGAIHAPFVGEAWIGAAPLIGAIFLATVCGHNDPIVREARGSRGVLLPLAASVVTALALALIAGGAWLIGGVPPALPVLQEASARGGLGLVGALLGAAMGFVLGAHVGLCVSVCRWFGSRSAGSGEGAGGSGM